MSFYMYRIPGTHKGLSRHLTTASALSFNLPVGTAGRVTLSLVAEAPGGVRRSNDPRVEPSLPPQVFFILRRSLSRSPAHALQLVGLGQIRAGGSR